MHDFVNYSVEVIVVLMVCVLDFLY